MGQSGLQESCICTGGDGGEGRESSTTSSRGGPLLKRCKATNVQ